jgi:hypothetical protein
MCACQAHETNDGRRCTSIEYIAGCAPLEAADEWILDGDGDDAHRRLFISFHPISQAANLPSHKKQDPLSRKRRSYTPR